MPPRAECAPAWRKSLFDLLPRVDLIIAIGAYAHKWHLGERRRETLTETVAAWQDIVEGAEAPHIMPLPHPSWRNNSWLKRNPWFELELLPDLRRRVARRLGQS